MFQHDDIDNKYGLGGSRRSLTKEVRVRSHICPCGICGGQSDTGTGNSPSIAEFSSQQHSTKAS
jgi:hypothetical protein